MQTRTSFEQTNSLFYTKYSSTNKAWPTFKGRFRSFQASAPGNYEKLEQIEQMYNNYNLFKYGKCSTSQRPNSLHNANREPENNKYKNYKERVKDSDNLKRRLEAMKKDRKEIFQKLKTIRPIKLSKVN